jgi:AcrR family transcriptional regulator
MLSEEVVPMGTGLDTGRVNQKARTRMAIVSAARELVRTGQPVTMPAVAQAALVSEPTAYRYFPDLLSLLTEAFADLWPDPEQVMQPVAGSSDPAERVAYATEFLLRHVLACQGAVRAMIAATIARPELTVSRPGLRFGLIDHALAPLRDTLAVTDPDAYAQLHRDLSVVVSAEALFTLTDLCGLSPDQAIASAASTARTLTTAAADHLRQSS